MDVCAQTGKAGGLARAVDEFLLDCKARRTSPRTRSGYGWQLGRWVTWLRERSVMEIGDVTRTQIRAYLAELEDAGWKVNSQRGAAAAIRRLLNWCVDEGLLSVSPWKQGMAPRKDKRILPAFSEADVDALLAACEGPRKSLFDRIRGKAIVLCLLDTGCRATEFVNLNIGDVTMKTGEVRIRAGKGRKDRSTRLGARARAALAAYLDAERRSAGPEAPLWVSRETGGRLGAAGLRGILDRLRERSGVAHCHPHTFRRTAATWLYRNGATAVDIAALLGHADLQTLQRYLDLATADYQDAHRRASPVDNLHQGAGRAGEGATEVRQRLRIVK